MFFSSATLVVLITLVVWQVGGNELGADQSPTDGDQQLEELIQQAPKIVQTTSHEHAGAGRDTVLTFSTSVKPLTASSNITQWNSLCAWHVQTDIQPPPRVYVLGQTRNAEVLTRMTNTTYIPEVGSIGRPPIPILRFMFEKIKWAEPHSQFYIFCTSDIIFPPDFGQKLLLIRKQYPEFLAVGQRTTLPVRQRINFKNESWFEPLRIKAKGHHLDNPWAIDYFAYTPNLYGDLSLLPQLLIGRTYIDNWLLHYARKRNQAVIDITEAVPVVH